MSEVELSEAPLGGYTVSLPSFEGPLDLLLHLCQKHELDILDIPIAFVTEKYLEFLAVMQMMNLDLASEYLVMAATLAHIKSKQLLPAPPPGQEDDAAAGEEEDPREALIRRLLEYQKYKQAAADLAARGVAGRDVFLRGMKLEEAVDPGLPPLAQVPLFSLVEAFQGVLAQSKIKLSHDVVHERMTLTDRINELVDVLRVKKRVQFEELFDGLTTRFDLVITFLALLEMTKLRMTRLFQADPEAPIFVEFAAQVAVEGADGGGPADAPGPVEGAAEAFPGEAEEAPAEPQASSGAAPAFDDAAIDALAATERGWDFEGGQGADESFATLPPDTSATAAPPHDDEEAEAEEEDVGAMDLAALAAKFAPPSPAPNHVEEEGDLHVTRFDTTRSAEGEPLAEPEADRPSEPSPLDTERPPAGSSSSRDAPREDSRTVTDDAVPSSEDDSDQT